MSMALVLFCLIVPLMYPVAVLLSVSIGGGGGAACAPIPPMLSLGQLLLLHL
jgi:hypothetical protein